ncbi:MAG: ATP-binding protein [Chlamydiae bacterium]|nr:MAG: ATP-binding protein [Chlamydiota bacterium]
MYELSLFVLDLVQNSITADAKLIKIWLFEFKTENLVSITVADNGKGMSEEVITKAIDPFMTSKVERKKKIGLGLPFFKQLIESCEGKFRLKSKLGIGTVVTGKFPYNNIDQPPVGNLEETILNLVIANPKIDFRFTRKNDENNKVFDTRPVRKMLGDDAESIWQSSELKEWFRNELKFEI